MRDKVQIKDKSGVIYLGVVCFEEEGKDGSCTKKKRAVDSCLYQTP